MRKGGGWQWERNIREEIGIPKQSIDNWSEIVDDFYSVKIFPSKYSQANTSSQNGIEFMPSQYE